jgi:polyhydroxybutyrate depolymerase
MDKRRSSMRRFTSPYRRGATGAAGSRRMPRWWHASGCAGVCAALAVALTTADVSAAATPADDRCLRPDLAGDTTVDVRIDGASYPVSVYIPDGARRNARLPLVLNLHGSRTNGSIQMQVTDMRAVADEEGFIVAAPNGAIPVPPPPSGQDPDGSWAWNVPGVPLNVGELPPPTARDDVEFLGRVIDVVSRRLCTDLRRTYATGFSGGGRMTSALACRIAGKLTAIAPVAGLRAGRAAPDEPTVPDVDDCRPARPVPVLTFHGQQDPVNPYLGNDDLRWGYSVPVAAQTWARLDGCRRGPQARPISEIVTRLSYKDCRDDVVVELYRIADGSHIWPLPAAPGGPGLGAEGVDASRVMWEFFERFRSSSSAGR